MIEASKHRSEAPITSIGYTIPTGLFIMQSLRNGTRPYKLLLDVLVQFYQSSLYVAPPPARSSSANNATILHTHLKLKVPVLQFQILGVLAGTVLTPNGRMDSDVQNDRQYCCWWEIIPFPNIQYLYNTILYGTYIYRVQYNSFKQ